MVHATVSRATGLPRQCHLWSHGRAWRTSISPRPVAHFAGALAQHSDQCSWATVWVWGPPTVPQSDAGQLRSRPTPCAAVSRGQGRVRGQRGVIPPCRLPLVWYRRPGNGFGSCACSGGPGTGVPGSAERCRPATAEDTPTTTLCADLQPPRLPFAHAARPLQPALPPRACPPEALPEGTANHW